MKNQTINKQFLSAIDVKTRDDVLSAIADHYGITKDVALQEVTHEEAEHLLEYLTGDVRAATSMLMRKHSFAAETDSPAVRPRMRP